MSGNTTISKLITVLFVFGVMFSASMILAMLNYKYMTAYGNPITHQPDYFHGELRYFSLPMMSQSTQHHHHNHHPENNIIDKDIVISTLTGEDAFRLSMALEANIGIQFIPYTNEEGEFKIAMVLVTDVLDQQEDNNNNNNIKTVDSDSTF